MELIYKVYLIQRHMKHWILRKYQFQLLDKIIRYFCVIIFIMIAVYLRRSNGKGTKLNLNSEGLIIELQQQVSKLLNQPLLKDRHNNECQIDYDLYFKGVKIDFSYNYTISDVGIQQNSIVHIIQNVRHPKDAEINKSNYLIKVIIFHKIHQFQIDKQAEVKDLIETISEQIKIKKEDLTLSFLGIQMEPNSRLQNYHIESGSLISIHINGVLENFQNKYQESISSQSDSIPKIARNLLPSRKKLKKADSLNTEAVSLQNRFKNINFMSMRLNKIEEKNDESKNESQLQQELEEEDSEWQNNNLGLQSPVERQKLTLESLSKPWYNSGKIVETQSIVGDEQEDQIMTECLLEVSRVDKMRQYTFECTGQDTFEQAKMLIAQLQKVDPKQLKLIININETVKSNISSMSNKSQKSICGLSPRSQKHSKSLTQLLIANSPKILTIGQMTERIFDRALSLKTKLLAIEYQIEII